MTEDDLKKMLAAEVHHGTTNCDSGMRKYVWRRRQDGIHLIHLGKTWEKLMLAARVIVAIENPADVCAVSGRTYGQRAVFKYAQNTGSSYIGGRYTPGTFTNQIQKKFQEPRLLIVADPRLDHQPILESSYVNVPVIAFCDTDAPLKNVDIAIPCNNKSRNSIALMFWFLAREINRLRGVLHRGAEWNVMPDLFLYREPEEVSAAVEQSDDLTSAPEATNNFAQPLDSSKVAEWGAPTDGDFPAAGLGAFDAAGDAGRWSESTNPNWDGAAPAAAAAPASTF
jgi:small subunit ribosomal protein SAe